MAASLCCAALLPFLPLVVLCGAAWVAQCADTPVFAVEKMLPAP